MTDRNQFGSMPGPDDEQRGAAWLRELKQHRPEPPADLMARILSKTSQTSQTPAASSVLAARPMPFRPRAVQPGGLRALVQMFLQPRLAMTAAMAFFSIALTLNLTGVRLSSLRDLRPSSTQRAFYATRARLARTFSSMRVVYELESRVREMQQEPDGAAPSRQNDSNHDSEHPKQFGPRTEPGTSRRETPGSREELVTFEPNLHQHQQQRGTV